MSAAQVTASQLSATEGTTYIPFNKPRKRETLSEPFTDPYKTTPTPGVRLSETYPLDWGILNMLLNRAIFEELKPTISQLVAFAKQDRTTQDSEFGVNEIPMALVVGQDRPLLSALLNKVVRIVTNVEEYTDEEGEQDEEEIRSEQDDDDEDRVEVQATRRTHPAPLVVRLDEGDCNNTASALRALVGGFISQFEEAGAEIPAKRKTSTALAPFDMARLVAGYEDYVTAREKSINLVVVIEQLEAFDIEVIQCLVYACSKHLDSLPISFLATVSDSNYLQRAFTTSTRTMLDTMTLSRSGGYITEIILGETSIKVLKDIMNRTKGCIDALITALQLIHIEHCWYQKAVFDAAKAFVSEVKPLYDAAKKRSFRSRDDYRLSGQTAEPEDVLLAFLTLSKRKAPLADGFSPADVNPNLTHYKLYQQAEELELSNLMHRMARPRYALTALFHLTWCFYELGAYRQEIPLSYLDLLELLAKGPKEIERYTTWMLRKGFESTPVADLATLAQTVLDRTGKTMYNPENPSHNIRRQLEAIVANKEQLDQQARARFANRVTYAMSHYFTGYEHAYHELYITESTDGLKELIDPTPRSVILTGLIRPGAYFRCECCDPEESHAPETTARMPDTCALFQRSLDA
ncbi:hypothetical protein FRC08_011986, partial [Ceratobasidium sp. 394]